MVRPMYFAGVSTGLKMRLCNVVRGPHHVSVGAVVQPPTKQKLRGAKYGVVQTHATQGRRCYGFVSWHNEYGRRVSSSHMLLCGLKPVERSVVAQAVSHWEANEAAPQSPDESSPILDTEELVERLAARIVDEHTRPPRDDAGRLMASGFVRMSSPSRFSRPGARASDVLRLREPD